MLIWSARAATYQPGFIVRAKTRAAWSHGKYGPRQFEQQFGVAIDHSFVPEIGDSGGPVLTVDARLVGFLAALSCVVTEAGNCIAHCVPAIPCLRLLGLRALSDDGHSSNGGK